MCSRGVSNGPWCSLPPPFLFHFLITSPLPCLAGAQKRLSLRYFHLPHHPTLPGYSMTPQQQEMGICSTRFSFPHSVCFSLLTPFLRAHTLGTGHRSFQAPWVWRGNYSPFWSPPAPHRCHCFLLNFEKGSSSIISHSSHGGRWQQWYQPTSLLLLVYNNQPIWLKIILLPLVCIDTIRTLRCHGFRYLLQQSGQEDRGGKRETYCRSLCSSQTGSLNEQSHPSSVSTLWLLPLHHNPTLSCSSS